MTLPIELGQRIRETRLRQGLTLKELDERAGLSATHLSEIERGRTSPTVGALLRIAAALGHDPAYFLEPEILPDTAYVQAGQASSIPIGEARGELITPGITGGRLRGLRLELPAGGEGLELSRGEGGEGLFVVAGEVDLAVGEETWSLKEGDSAYFPAEGSRRLKAIGARAAQVLIVTTAAWPTSRSG